MIHFYSGTPGSGKSLHVAEEIYNILRCSKNVIANFEINESLVKPLTKKKKLGYFIACENFELSVPSLKGFSDNFHIRKNGKILEKQTYLIVDECQLKFNARSWDAKGRDTWTSFFTQHRKYGYEIILISQFDRLIDRQIRSLIEYEYKHRKVNNYKLLGKVMGVFSGGSLFVYIVYWYGVRERISSTFFRGRKRYYDFYDSYKIFDSTE